MLYVVSLSFMVNNLFFVRLEGLTLKAAEYGIPMGRLAKIARSLFGATPLNPRLWVISWIARKRLWLAVPPIA